MKRYLILYAVCATALLICGYRLHRAETDRLAQNRTALAAQVEHYRNRLGEATASALALRLRCREFEALRSADAERIRSLGIRIRRLEAVSKHVTHTVVEAAAATRDTVLAFRSDAEARIRSGTGIHPTIPHPEPATHLSPYIPQRIRPCGISGQPARGDTVRVFRWQDAWTTVEGVVTADSVICRVESIDTLHQVVYRVPHRFLFFRWGTKAVRQEISSSNPHARIVWTEHIELEKRP